MRRAVILALVLLTGGGALAWHHLTQVPAVSRSDVPSDAPLNLTAKRFGAITGDAVVIAPPRADLGNQNHAYLHHDGTLFYAMWSSGPPVEGEPGQEVRYATSPDGMNWSAPRLLLAPRSEDRGLIARGFWAHPDGLRAVISEYRGKGAFGPGKELVTFAALPETSGMGGWRRGPVLFEGHIPNYPPVRLDGRDWISLRDTSFATSVMHSSDGGRTWQDSGPVPADPEGIFRPDEPVVFSDTQDAVCVAMRNNGADRRVFYSCREGEGDWSPPHPTALPSVASKLFMMQMADGRWLVSGNFEPRRGRSTMHLGMLEADGTIPSLLRVVSPSAWTVRSPSTLQYPHTMVHGDYLYLAYSIDKARIEMMRLPLDRVRTMQGEAGAQGTSLVAGALFEVHRARKTVSERFR